jgi:hypothetical protein
MSKGLEIIKLYEDSKYLNTFHPNFMKDLQIVKKDLQRLEAIENANPTEALECVDKLEQVIEEITISNADLRNALKASVSLAIIKHALLKAQEQEKDKAFLKNIHNTNVKVPLVNIFNGLSQEKRFAYTEHIYYNWEEMKESLEAEIENIKTEKENLESKAKRQEKVLEIIKEKEVNMQVFNQCEDVETYNKVYIKQKDRQLTQEEFDTLKRYFK